MKAIYSKPIFMNRLLSVFCVIFYSHSLLANPVPSLSDSDSILIGRSCAKVADLWEINSFGRYEPKILSINSNGALIGVSVNFDVESLSGDKGGWSERVVKIRKEKFTCLFNGVKKGNYSIRPTMIIEYGSNDSIIAVRAFVRYKPGPAADVFGGIIKASESWSYVYSKSNGWTPTCDHYGSCWYYQDYVTHNDEWLRKDEIFKLVNKYPI